MTSRTVSLEKRFSVLCICCITQRKTQEKDGTGEAGFGETSKRYHIHKLWFLVWKNIRERLQKYDTDMTKAKPLKKKLSLSGLRFSKLWCITYNNINELVYFFADFLFLKTVE